MSVINKCIAGLFILLVCSMPADCLAQQKAAAPANQRLQFYFDEPVTLDSLTRYVHSHSTIRFSFNSSKVKGNKVINLKKGTYTMGLLLQEIRKNTSLYYIMYNGYVIFQDNPPKQKTTPHRVAKKNYPKPPPPVRRIPPRDTTHIIAHTNPDSLNRVIVVDAPAAIDTVMASHGVKDTTANNLLLTTMAGGTPGKDYIDVVDTKKGQTQKGKAAVPARNSNRPWVKDTMQTKTKVIRTDVSKKDGRTVARPFRATTWHWQFGLHWKVTIPVNGSGYYFTGPNNRSQPYNPLIPGIWLSRHNEQHEILLLVKPAEWTGYGNNVIKADSSIRNYGSDTLLPSYVPLRKTTSFIKSGGIYAGLQYNYHLNENFVIGAGIGYQTLGQTLGLHQIKRLIDTGTNGKNFPDTLFTAKGDSLTNKYLRSSVIMAKFEVAYKVGMLDLGAAVVLPLTSPFTSKSKEQGRPLNVQVFVRWRLKREGDSF